MGDLFNSFRFPIGSVQFPPYSSSISILNQLGVPVGEVMLDGTIKNHLGIPVGRISRQGEILNNLGMRIGPLVLENLPPNINSSGISGSPSGFPVVKTNAESLLELLGAQSPVQVLPPPNPGFPIPAPQSKPAATPPPLPLESRYPTQYARLVSYASSYSGLELPQEQAEAWARKNLQLFVDQDRISLIEKFIRDFDTWMVALRSFATDCLRYYGSDAKKWAFEHQGLKINIKLLKCYFTEFYELASSSSYYNLSSETAREWAFEQAKNYVPRDVPLNYDPTSMAGSCYEKIIQAKKDAVHHKFNYLKRIFEMEYKNAHGSKFLGGQGLSETDARKTARGIIEQKFYEVFKC